MNRTLFFILFGVIFGALYAANKVEAVPQALFEEAAELELTLEGPFRTLTRERNREPELPALLRYRLPEGGKIELNVQIMPRGISRLRNCRFPPLRLNFKTEEVAGTIFAGQDKLKLVTHCKRTTGNRNSVAREYQVYRAYNLVTDRSFRVRWLSIEYIDTESSRKSYIEPGFFIEEDRAAAARLGMETLDVGSLAIAELDQVETSLMALFKFMIGNVDWSALKGAPGQSCCHNFKVLSPPGQSTGRVILPYDFDQAGFVAAEYAVHNESLGLRPNERLYKGYCEMNDKIESAIKRLAQIKVEWLRILDAGPVSEYARQHGVRYIESGYRILADPKRLERSVIGRCRQ